MDRLDTPSPEQLPATVRRVAERIAGGGGRALLVGGSVRDLALRADCKDFDFEVYGLTIDELEAVLGTLGDVIAVGKSFGVLRVKGLDIDFSIPRRDNKLGKGHRGFRVTFDPEMTFEDASRRRDLTVNSMGLDPVSGELLDPHGGLEDLRAKRLRATDPATFSEDPLRALRVAQLLARLEARATSELEKLCAVQELDDLPGERIWDELEKLFLKAARPSIGLAFLERTDLLRWFPELRAIVGVSQDPAWHPEGNVWEHTLLVVDEAASRRSGDRDEDLVLMYAALCHDLGKATTTYTDEEGRVRSPGHEAEGVAPTTALLERMRAPNVVIDRVCALVRHHLAPAQFAAQNATPKAYRRLARRLGAVDLSLEFLERVARADHFGRTTSEAIARVFPAGDEFIASARALEVQVEPTRDVVLGRHLLARGFEPGPRIGEILRACRDYQDETGADDPALILEAVLAGWQAKPSPDGPESGPHPEPSR